MLSPIFFQHFPRISITSQEDTETESKRKILSSLEDTMEEELQCSICTELLIEATSLNCSHSFCAFCLKVRSPIGYWMLIAGWCQKAFLFADFTGVKK